MREATKEEIEGVNRYVESIAKPTGKNFYDLVDDVQDEIDFVQEHKKISCIIKIENSHKDDFMSLDEAIEILENTTVTPDLHPDEQWKWDEAVRLAISELKSKRDKGVS